MANILQEISTSEEFIKFKKEFPMKAMLRYRHYESEWALFLTHVQEYKAYRDTIKMDNEATTGWGDGKIGGSVPAIIIDWLKWRAELRGDMFDTKDLIPYLKKHPEYLCVEKSRL